MPASAELLSYLSNLDGQLKDLEYDGTAEDGDEDANTGDDELDSDYEWHGQLADTFSTLNRRDLGGDWTG